LEILLTDTDLGLEGRSTVSGRVELAAVLEGSDVVHGDLNRENDGMSEVSVEFSFEFSVASFGAAF
jgi:hypothetical protein